MQNTEKPYRYAAMQDSRAKKLQRLQVLYKRRKQESRCRDRERPHDCWTDDASVLV